MNKDQAIVYALAEAMRKYDTGKLIACNHPDYDKIMGAAWGDEGDPETIYSIASLYADDNNNDGTWEDAIIELLKEQFPGFD